VISVLVFWSISWTIKRIENLQHFLSDKWKKEGRRLWFNHLLWQWRIERFLLRAYAKNQRKDSDYANLLRRCYNRITLNVSYSMFLSQKSLWGLACKLVCIKRKSFTMIKVYKGTKSGEILRYFLVKGMYICITHFGWFIYWPFPSSTDLKEGLDWEIFVF